MGEPTAASKKWIVPKCRDGVGCGYVELKGQRSCGQISESSKRCPANSAVDSLDLHKHQIFTSRSIMQLATHNA